MKSHVTAAATLSGYSVLGPMLLSFCVVLCYGWVRTSEGRMMVASATQLYIIAGSSDERYSVMLCETKNLSWLVLWHRNADCYSTGVEALSALRICRLSMGEFASRVFPTVHGGQRLSDFVHHLFCLGRGLSIFFSFWQQRSNYRERRSGYYVLGLNGLS